MFSKVVWKQQIIARHLDFTAGAGMGIDIADLADG